ALIRCAMCPTRFLSSAPFDPFLVVPIVLPFSDKQEKDGMDKSVSYQVCFSFKSFVTVIVSCISSFFRLPNTPLSPSSPDSGFSSDDGGPFNGVTRPKTQLSAFRKHRPSPSSKKSVRFADCVGLELATTKLFFPDEEDFANPTCRFDVTHRLFPTNFVYRSESESVSRTRREKVIVSSFMTSNFGQLMGQIRVLDLAFDKEVDVRYTRDGWITQHELLASFSHKLIGNNDIDVFCFALTIPHEDESICQLCVHYSVSDASFWDNNDGENYRFDWIGTEKKP
ncbi:hypothetical protein PMAYCL1PPCAC_16137, partial [Pristionchus mayeri]